MKAVIFDVDGTLYDQRKLRIRILFDMFLTVLRRPRSFSELKIVFDFRRAREQCGASAMGRIDRMQYEWGAQRSKATAARVRRAVQEWMFERPLRYLPFCRFKGVDNIFADLRAAHIRIGIFSDYPAGEKLCALGLKADAIVSSVDAEVDRLKPAPEGLKVVAEKLHVSIAECLFIGDRDDKDGECARRAGMPYLVLTSPGRYFARANPAEMIDTWRNSCKK